MVYTPDWVARDMVDYFKPSGRILEPCAGDGAFLKYLPGAEWCEIEKGRDFFAWHEPVDWCFGNPPYKIFDEWLVHSCEISSNIVYVLPIHLFWRGMGRISTALNYGGVVHTRIYGNGQRLGFPFGNPAGAIHFHKGYRGPMTISMFDA